MASVQIDKLLQTVINLGASDLHITVGQPPVVRLDGHMRRLETKSLEADDTTALMKSITPERCQTELQEVGSTDFGMAFGDQARFRVAVFKQRGHVGIVLRRIPYKFLTFEQLGLPPAINGIITRPRGLFLVTGPTGSGKTTSLASMINWLNENHRPPHHHDRRPDRVLPPAQEVDDLPARNRRRHSELPRSPSPRVANGSRLHPRRRNARPGDDLRGDHRGRNRATSSSRRCTRTAPKAR